jgi:hypothetical protein
MHRLPTIAAKLTSARVLPMGRKMGRMIKCLKTVAALAALAAVFCVLLAGCGQKQRPRGTMTPSLFASSTETLMPTETLTKSPTETITPTYSNTYTPEKWMISYDATANAISTMVAPFPGLCEDWENNPYSTLISPDGEWLAVNCFQINLSGKFQLLKRDGSRSIEILYKDLYADLQDFCSIGASPLHWTANDQYLFFSRNAACWESGGAIPLGMKYGPLFRLDIQSGKWEKIIDDDKYDVYYYFSPTDRRLVYLHAYTSHVINILDLKTGDLENFALSDYGEVGGVIWSPDGTSIALIASRRPVDADFDHMKYSVIIYDVLEKKLTPIISDRQERRIPQEWTYNNILVIPLVVNDYFYEIVPGQTLYYDFNTNTLIQPTPTP